MFVEKYVYVFSFCVCSVQLDDFSASLVSEAHTSDVLAVAFGAEKSDIFACVYMCVFSWQCESCTCTDLYFSLLRPATSFSSFSRSAVESTNVVLSQESYLLVANGMADLYRFGSLLSAALDVSCINSRVAPTLDILLLRRISLKKRLFVQDCCLFATCTYAHATCLSSWYHACSKRMYMTQ